MLEVLTCLTWVLAQPLHSKGTADADISQTVFRGVLQAELKKGEIIALVGAGGGLGHLGCQFAKALGLVVVGIDARNEGLALAKESGADVVVDARQDQEKVVEEVKKVTNGVGVDATVNVSDSLGAAGLACAVTKMHGTMIQIAQASQRKSQPWDFPDLFHSLPKSQFLSMNSSSEMYGLKALSSVPVAKLSGCSRWLPITTSPSKRIHSSD